MNSKPKLSAEILARRRQELIAISHAQRMMLADQGHVVLRSLAIADIGMTLIGHIRKNPLLTTGLVLGVVLVKPHRIIAWMGTGLMLWKNMRVVMPLLTPLFHKLKASKAHK